MTSQNRTSAFNRRNSNIRSTMDGVWVIFFSSVWPDCASSEERERTPQQLINNNIRPSIASRPYKATFYRSAMCRFRVALFSLPAKAGGPRQQLPVQYSTVLPRKIDWKSSRINVGFSPKSGVVVTYVHLACESCICTVSVAAGHRRMTAQLLYWGKVVQHYVRKMGLNANFN